MQPEGHLLMFSGFSTSVPMEGLQPTLSSKPPTLQHQKRVKEARQFLGSFDVNLKF
jgi:hypothetical protein